MIEGIMTGVVQAVGHPAMIPLGLVGVGLMFLVAGVDIANVTISIFTLLLLPVLQHSQNRDGAAIQAKLDELIRSSDARNDFIGLDKQPEKEIKKVRDEP